jgi:alpha-1,2-glucosyltransferase
MIDWDAVHTAVNICLFPPIFFFSGLYYTDVLSTYIVIKAYEHFLRGATAQPGSIFTGVFTYLIGVMALLMRQTNIFWVAVFMGGLELARAFHKMLFIEGSEDYTVKGRFNDFVMFCYRGAFHDLTLEQAGAFGNSPSLWTKDKLTKLDFLLCVASLGAVTISHPKRVAARLWPYVALLVSFAGFVFWNGGVVLGELAPNTSMHTSLTSSQETNQTMSQPYTYHRCFIYGHSWRSFPCPYSSQAFPISWILFCGGSSGGRRIFHA